MTGLAVRLMGILAAAIRASVWLVAIFAILVSVLTTLSRSDPGADQAIWTPPDDSSLEAAFIGVNEQAADPQHEASGSGRLVPDPAPDAITVATFWDNGNERWLHPFDPAQADFGSAAGEIPSLLTVGNLVPGTAYQVWLDYSGCGTPYSAGIDFLTSSPSGAVAPDLITSGPGRNLPDARVPIPGDLSQTQPPGMFDLWGATFLTAPRGPFRSVSCSEDKLITLSLMARSDTIFLLWGSHISADGRALRVIPQDGNPALSGTGARQIVLSPVTAVVRPDWQATEPQAGQD